MKKMGLAVLLASILMFTVVSTGRAQTASDPFTGRWVVTDYKVGGTPNSDDIDDSVTIRTDGRFYYVSCLDARSEHISFTRQGNSLEGDYLADFNYLTSHYRGMPQGVLSQAVGRIKYHCTIVFDGTGLIAKSANAEISHTTDGTYRGYTPLNGFYSWYLKGPFKD
jgi:hypothetical protein